MSLMAANEESDPSAILNGFWVTLFYFSRRADKRRADKEICVFKREFGIRKSLKKLWE